MNVGYIGLGAMGGALARRLVGQHPLWVWDLNRAAVDTFVQLGASAARSAADLARACDVVLLCLPRTADVRQALFGADGVMEGLSPGKIVVDQTSGVPSQTREIATRLAQAGIGMLDASISGNPTTVVPAGRATIMVSGPEDTFGKVLPVLNTLSSNVIRCGQRLGDAQAMKLVNNTINAGCRLATLEAAATGRKLGLSLREMTDRFNGSHSRNRTSMDMLPALLEGRKATNFSLALMLKDLNQAIRLGQEFGAPMPIASTVRSILQIGVNTLGQDARLEDVIQLTENLAATKLAETACAVADRKDRGESGADLLRVIDSTVTVCNRLVTYEAVAMGRKYGLGMSDLASVVNTSTGWNGESERILPALMASGPTDTLLLQQAAADLQRACDAAIDTGAPALLASAVRSLLEVGLNQLGDGATLDTMARLFESMAKVRFADMA